MTPTPPRLQPALLGGALIGVLSALPVVGWLNTCCCLWVVIGGAIALWISQSNHPYPVTAADGALVGLLAGLVGGLVAIPLNMVFEPVQRQLILRMINSTQAEIPPQFRAMMENTQRGPIVVIFSGLFMTVVYAIFAMLGGLLGVALFKKKDASPPPGTVEVLPPDGGTSF